MFQRTTTIKAKAFAKYHSLRDTGHSHKHAIELVRLSLLPELQHWWLDTWTSRVQDAGNPDTIAYPAR